MSHDESSEVSSGVRGRSGADGDGFRADQMEPAERLSERQSACREPQRLRQGRRGRHRRQADDHRPRRRLAVQGAGDQARGGDRAGADGRNPDLDPGERRPDLRHRRGAVPGDELPAGDEALAGVAAGDREEARGAGHHGAVRRALGTAGHLLQERDQHHRRHEGPEVAGLQRRHRADRRDGRRAGGDGAGGRVAAGAGDRRGQLVHVVGRDRLRFQGLGDR